MQLIDDYLTNKIDTIIAETNCQLYKLFIGGKNNFRYHIRNDYKANRIGVEKPALFYATKQLLIDKWNAFVSNGLETDDTVVATAKWCMDNGIRLHAGHGLNYHNTFSILHLEI